jgi:dTDP-glucose pyrophosphorylase
VAAENAIIDRPNTVKKAVILARGLGKRMRRTDNSVQLASGQREPADAGVKAMIAVGRPFLDFVLSALADSGIGEACIVIGPEHAAVREYYDSLSLRRISVVFAIQEQPLGTANAVLAARKFAADEPFLVLNSDNYYPAGVFSALRILGEPGVAAFERESLVRESNIPRDRVRDYALLQTSADGWLETIVEKPERLSDAGEEMFVSMNCWRFDAGIFRACEEVPKSTRGEFELPQAVQLGISSLGMRFKAVAFRVGVLDLSYRSDVDSVAQHLAHVRPEL